jgi:hypothetical protein
MSLPEIRRKGAVDLNVPQLQIKSIRSPFKVAPRVPFADVETGSSAASGLRSDYDGSPPMQRSPDETNKRETWS